MTLQPIPTIRLTRPPDWMDDALCAQTAPAAFFPAPGNAGQTAKRICGMCDVRAECLDYVLAFEAADDNHYPSGVWGGTTPMERRAMRRKKGAAA